MGSSRGKHFSAPTAAISVSGPYLTTSSIDGDSLIMSAEFLERELVGPYKFTKHQVRCAAVLLCCCVML
jgi:hypothetical protein